MMLQNHIPAVTYAISSIVLVIAGDALLKHIIMPITKLLTKRIFKIIGIFIGTLVFLAWTYFGSMLIGNLLLKTEVINANNIDWIALVSFIILAIFLNIKYDMGW